MKKFYICLSCLVIMLEMPVSSFGQVNFTSSNLPIIVIDTHGLEIVDEPKITADMGIIDNGPGVRNDAAGPFNNYNGKIGIEFHGSSQQGFPKKPYGFELQDDAGEGIDASLLGMPKKDDWVLLAAYDDKSLMRDALAYKLGRDQGRYASRTRYCELVVNGEYQGIYVLAEKIKRDKNRVNIAKLDPEEVSGEDLTGGYIIKIDKTTGSGGAGWTSSHLPLGSQSGQHIYFQYEYPKEEDIADAQKTYIKSYVDEFEANLASENFKDPVNGYPKYIDVASFVDFFIMNEITKNPDGYRLSTFFHKKNDAEGGKLWMGPIWDFNEGFGNVDYCTQGDPYGFALNFNSLCPDDYWQIPFWWDRLFQDEQFGAAVTARWAALREGPLKTNTILSYVDSVSAVLDAEALERDSTTWGVLGEYVWPNYYVGETYQSEVDWLEEWITDRLSWLDENLSFIVTATEPVPAVFTLETYPNPFVQGFQFEYSIDRPGLLSIDAFDMLGRKLDHIERDHPGNGKYEIEYNRPGWPSGTYFFKANFENRTVVRKVVKK